MMKLFFFPQYFQKCLHIGSLNPLPLYRCLKTSKKNTLENIEKGENAGIQIFLLFPRLFLPFQ